MPPPHVRAPLPPPPFRAPRLFMVVVALVLAALALPACEFLPQTGTEWGIAGAIFGGIVGAIVYFAWKNSKGPPKT